MLSAAKYSFLLYGINASALERGWIFKMSKPTILIVDDNEKNILSLRSLLEEELENVQILDAKSGIIALSLLMNEKVDLIILDIQMAHMDGFETAKFILSRQKTQHIPIVFLTAAYKSDDFKQKGYELGACDYLTKPIDPDKLIDKVKGYLRLVQQGQKTVELPQAKMWQKNHVIDEVHDLLDIIICYSEILEKEATKFDDARFVKGIKKVNQAGKDLQNLVNNVLEPKLKM